MLGNGVCNALKKGLERALIKCLTDRKVYNSLRTWKEEIMLLKGSIFAIIYHYLIELVLDDDQWLKISRSN